MIVKLIKQFSEEDDAKLESLTIGRVYEVIGIEADYFRIICDTEKEPYLYPPECFDIVDHTKPSFWITEFGEDGEEYSYPEEWNKAGYFEAYFEEVTGVKEKFWIACKKYYR